MSDDLYRRFRPWLIETEDDRCPFFTEGLVILDANILLNLYRMTNEAREQVLQTLQRVADQDRLWMPHHAALEFVRGRKKVTQDRSKDFDEALAQIERRFNEAESAVVKARNDVQGLIGATNRDAATVQRLARLITTDAVRSAYETWREELREEVKALKEKYETDPDNPDSGTSLVDRINSLLDGRIGDGFPMPEVPELVHFFMDYRMPNRIPPGFKDEGKQTAVASAGDFLLWEQILREAAARATTDEEHRLLVVSDDVKPDWRDQDRRRVRTDLAYELWVRARAIIRIETMEGFVQGVEEFLGVTVSQSTIAEVASVSARDREDLELPLSEEIAEQEEELTEEPRTSVINETNAVAVSPEAFLPAVSKASKLMTREAKETLATDNLFAWWLVGATAALGMRFAAPDEPEVKLTAAVLREVDGEEGPPPGPEWRSDRLRIGESIRDVWLAPWFAPLLAGLPAPDPRALRSIAGSELNLRLGSGLPNQQTA